MKACSAVSEPSVECTATEDDYVRSWKSVHVTLNTRKICIRIQICPCDRGFRIDAKHLTVLQCR